MRKFLVGHESEHPQRWKLAPKIFTPFVPLQIELKSKKKDPLFIETTQISTIILTICYFFVEIDQNKYFNFTSDEFLWPICFKIPL